jgi:hypothetical protein
MHVAHRNEARTELQDGRAYASNKGDGLNESFETEQDGNNWRQTTRICGGKQKSNRKYFRSPLHAVL